MHEAHRVTFQVKSRIQSLIATCRRHRVEPWAYLRDLLICMPVLRELGQITPEQPPPPLAYLWQPA